MRIQLRTMINSLLFFAFAAALLMIFFLRSDRELATYKLVDKHIPGLLDTVEDLLEDEKALNSFFKEVSSLASIIVIIKLHLTMLSPFIAHG